MHYMALARKPEYRPDSVDLDIRDLFALEAKQVGLTAEEAMQRIRSGSAGNSLLWDDLRQLALLL
jgi:hypothetical protein